MLRSPSTAPATRGAVTNIPRPSSQRSPMEPGLKVKNTFANGMISVQCDPQRDLLGYPKFQLASMGKSMGRYKCFRGSVKEQSPAI